MEEKTNQDLSFHELIFRLMNSMRRQLVFVYAREDYGYDIIH